MKRAIAATTTALILAALVTAALVRARTSTIGSPRDCLDQMYDAMRDGNVTTYLRCFSGELRDRLERDAREQSIEQFAEYLRETVAPLKGRAVTSDSVESPETDQARLVVDRVYADRPWELQAYRLRRVNDRWTIVAIEPAELHEPPIPYGTPAFQPDEEPTQSSAK